MELRTLKAQFAAEFIDIREAAQLEDARWEAFQFQYLNNTSRFAIDVKARQIAWSFTAALDAYCDSCIEPGRPYTFVSINQDEANEKVRYLRNIIDATDLPVRPKRVKDSTTEIELNDGSRFISHPCRPVRGKPQARVYLDEMAHYPEGRDREIYTAALPATTKGGGYIRIGSSPLGAKGLFWEIATQRLRAWPGYVRRFIPWWKVRYLCRNVQTASQIAHEMLTEERVRAFGTKPLIEIFENMFLEDFQQEYECAWVDESTAWITWDVITKNQDTNLVWWHARSVDEALHMLDEVKDGIRLGSVEHVFAGGIDVGRHKDLTEFCIVGKTTVEQTPVRFMVSLDNVAFDDQERCFETIISELPFTKVLVDRNGLGMQLAENLERKTGRAEGVDFTGPSKEYWAVGARVKAERGDTPLPVDRDLAYQIHSIKKTVTGSKHNKFDTERNEKHHADKFWAWALAIEAANASLQHAFSY